MKKETLEEAAENHLQKWRLLNNIHLSNILHAERCKNDFIAGANWQAERMYSEEDFKEFARNYYREIKLDKSNLLWEVLADKCFEQFKKK